MAGTMASALAATALVWKSSDSDYYTTCMTAAKSLYDYATGVYGNCGAAVSRQNLLACMAGGISIMYPQLRFCSA